MNFTCPTGIEITAILSQLCAAAGMAAAVFGLLVWRERFDLHKRVEHLERRTGIQGSWLEAIIKSFLEKRRDKGDE